MGQVNFWRLRRGLRRSEAEHRVSAIAGSTDVSVVSDGRQWAARTPARKLGQDAGCRPVRHGHRRGKARCPESAACRAFFSGLRTGQVTRRNSDSRRLVTLTLQRRNAKNNFAGRTLRMSVGPSHLTRNVARSPAKFRINPAVSDAVETLIDCMMLNTNRSINFPYWPAGNRFAPRTAFHEPGACWQRNEDGGAP